MDPDSLSSSSKQWHFFVKVAFATALASTALGIYFVPGPFTVKGYFLISSLFLVFSSITLSKTLRDQHEAERIHNRVSEARTSKMIRELDVE